MTALTTAVTEQVQQALPSTWHILDLESRPFRYATSCSAYELRVHVAGKEPVSLLLKDLSWEALLPDARRTRPRFLYDPRREIAMYTSVLDSAELGTAACYGTVSDEVEGRHWLLVEHVDGRELWQIGEFEPWKETARWLAAFHAREELLERAAAVPLLRYDASEYRRWPRRALRLRPGDTALEHLASRYEYVVERLAALPTTLIHGDCYPSNLLVAEYAGGMRVCPVDWELAAAGPGVLDLAGLVSGWPEPEETALVEAYGAGTSSAQTLGADLHELVRCARLHHCMRLLGWSADWSPPPEHARNWHEEAVTLAERLGL